MTANIDGSDWEALVTHALLGTNHRPFVAVDGLPAEDLAQAVAVLSVCRRAARLPSRPLPRPVAAPPASGVASPRVGLFFFAILEDGPAALLHEWMDALRQSGLAAPLDVLPALLTFMAERPDKDGEIRPLLGTRGHWLMRQRPDWAPLQDLSPEAFEAGTPAVRLDLFRRLRSGDAALARQWLDATWADETADRRLAFIRALGTGLSAADAPLLERAMQDRRRDVRTVATDLANRLKVPPPPSEADRSRQLLEALAQDSADVRVLAAACTFPWPADLSREFLTWLSHQTSRSAGPLRDISIYIDPRQLDLATEVLRAVVNGGVEDLLGTMNFRLRMLREIAASSPSTGA